MKCSHCLCRLCIHISTPGGRLLTMSMTTFINSGDIRYVWFVVQLVELIEQDGQKLSVFVCLAVSHRSPTLPSEIWGRGATPINGKNTMEREVKAVGTAKRGRENRERRENGKKGPMAKLRTYIHLIPLHVFLFIFPLYNVLLQTVIEFCRRNRIIHVSKPSCSFESVCVWEREFILQIKWVRQFTYDKELSTDRL